MDGKSINHKCNFPCSCLIGTLLLQAMRVNRAKLIVKKSNTFHTVPHLETQVTQFHCHKFVVFIIFNLTRVSSNQSFCKIADIKPVVPISLDNYEPFNDHSMHFSDKEIN